MKLFNKLFKRSVFPDLRTEHRVKEAFVFQGTQYYEFDDVHNMPCDRAFSAMDFYEELRQRCTREYLKAHVEAVEEMCTAKKINIFKIREANNFLKERIDFIYDADLIYKLASVMYFDKSENPYKYDMKYGQEKIANWKKSSIGSFFLDTPIQKLLPLQVTSAEDLEALTRTLEEVKKSHLSSLSSSLSSEQKKSAWYRTLTLQHT